MSSNDIVSATHRISDYHLAAGPTLPDGSPNLREDFRSDRDYGRMLKAFCGRFSPGTALTLEWAGDMVDFHAIPYRGRYASVQTVEAALEKFETSLEGHPAFWDATREFLADVRHSLVITIGNHDFEFAWPEVQARIRNRLGVAGDDPRVRFVTTVIEKDGTCKLHGDLFDPLNANPPEEHWFTVNIQGGKERKLLNVPYGTILNASLGQAMKIHQPWIGRMRNHGAIWALSLAREWYFSVTAILSLFRYVIHHRFFIGEPDVRRKANLRNVFKLLSSTMQEDAVEAGVRELVRKHPEVTSVEAGHTHGASTGAITVDGKVIAYLNTGTGIEQVRLKKPEYAHYVTPFPRVEAFFRRIVTCWKEKPATGFALVFTHSIAIAAPFFARKHFGWSLDELPWIVVVVASFSFLARQSFALHIDETFTELTPIETRRSADGRVTRTLLLFNPENGSFSAYPNP